MTSIRRRLTIVLLAGAALVPCRTAGAQIIGLPVHFSPSAENGLRLFGDFAMGDSPFELYGGGRALLNLAYASVGLMAGKRGDADAAWGANVALNLVRGSLRKYSLSIEAGYGDNEVTENGVSVGARDIPIGVGLALEVEQAGFVLEPWAGIRAHIRRSDVPGLGSETEVGAGISAGLNAGSGVLPKVGIPLPGVGAHIALDLLTMPRPFADGSSGSFVVSLGLNYLFRLDSLPLHGIIPPPSCDPMAPC
jgi:hypothetical protein